VHHEGVPAGAAIARREDARVRLLEARNVAKIKTIELARVDHDSGHHSATGTAVYKHRHAC
jgi:hypothetical protein